MGNKITKTSKYHMCQSCKKTSIEQIATYWCSICKEFICKECRMLHKQCKMLQNHTFIPIEELSSEDLEEINYPEFSCYNHEDEAAFFYCSNDKQGLCVACAKSLHTFCLNVFKLDDLAKNLCEEMKENDIKILQEINKIVDVALIEHAKAKSLFNQDVCEIKQVMEKTKCKSKGNKLSKEKEELLNEKIQNENRFYRKLKDNLLQFKLVLSEQIKTAESVLEMSGREAVSKLLEMQDLISREFITLQQAFTGVTNKRLSIENMSRNIVDFKVKETINLAANELSSIDHCINKLHKGLLPGEQAQVALDPIKLLPDVTPTLKKVVSSQDIGIGGAGLYGSTYLPDGWFMVTDRYRRKLLLFDASISLQVQQGVLFSPYGINVSLDGNHIYVMHYGGKLVTYKLERQFVKVSEIKIQDETTCVGVSGDTFITGHKDNITLYNKKGEKLSNISKTGTPTIICVSQDGNKFYYNDNNHIVCCNVSDLSVVFKFSHPDLKKIQVE